MSTKQYFILSQEQIDKVGNAIIYLCDAIGPMSKTKILKLVYMLDEMSIKKSGIPFFNLPYKVWKFGPVAEDLYVELSSELSLLKSYIKRDNTNFISANSFIDDEFTNNDIKLMDTIISTYGHSTAKELVRYTHRENAPWHNAATQNNILDLLIDEKISNTEIIIDFSTLISHDDTKKMIYQDYIEIN